MMRLGWSGSREQPSGVEERNNFNTSKQKPELSDPSSDGKQSIGKSVLKRHKSEQPSTVLKTPSVFNGKSRKSSSDNISHGGEPPDDLSKKKHTSHHNHSSSSSSRSAPASRGLRKTMSANNFENNNNNNNNRGAVPAVSTSKSSASADSPKKEEAKKEDEDCYKPVQKVNWGLGDYYHGDGQTWRVGASANKNVKKGVHAEKRADWDHLGPKNERDQGNDAASCSASSTSSDDEDGDDDGGGEEGKNTVKKKKDSKKKEGSSAGSVAGSVSKKTSTLKRKEEIRRPKDPADGSVHNRSSSVDHSPEEHSKHRKEGAGDEDHHDSQDHDHHETVSITSGRRRSASESDRSSKSSRPHKSSSKHRRNDNNNMSLTSIPDDAPPRTDSHRRRKSIATATVDSAHSRSADQISLAKDADPKSPGGTAVRRRSSMSDVPAPSPSSTPLSKKKGKKSLVSKSVPPNGSMEIGDVPLSPHNPAAVVVDGNWVVQPNTPGHDLFAYFLHVEEPVVYVQLAGDDENQQPEDSTKKKKEDGGGGGSGSGMVVEYPELNIYLAARNMKPKQLPQEPFRPVGPLRESLTAGHVQVF